MNTPEQVVPLRAISVLGHEMRRLAKTSTGSVVLGFLSLVVLSQIVVPLPFTPVPVSMGTLGAMLLGALLGPRRGTTAAILYAVGGASGLPILAGFQSGFRLASFGYVIGYIVAAALVGWLARRPGARSYSAGVLIALAGSAAVYLCGVLWMIGIFGIAPSAALTLGVLPFLIGDVIKSLVVAGVLRSTRG